MSAFKFLRPLAVAGITALPITAHAGTPASESFTVYGITDDVCMFRPTPVANSVELATVYKAPTDFFGTPMKAQDVMFEFSNRDRFIVRGKEIFHAITTDKNDPTPEERKLMNDYAPWLRNKCAAANDLKPL